MQEAIATGFSPLIASLVWCEGWPREPHLPRFYFAFAMILAAVTSPRRLIGYRPKAKCLD